MVRESDSGGKAFGANRFKAPIAGLHQIRGFQPTSGERTILRSMGGWVSGLGWCSGRLRGCCARASSRGRWSRVRKSERAQGVDQAGINRQAFAFDHPGVGGNRYIRAYGLNQSIAQNHGAFRDGRSTHRNHACVTYRHGAWRRGE